MNSGLVDAENLAWKLGFVLTGRADPALLDTYEIERAGAADHHIRVTGDTMKLMTPADAAGKARRDAVLEAAAADPAQAESDRQRPARRAHPTSRPRSPWTSTPTATSGPLPPTTRCAGVPAPDGRCLPFGATGSTTLRKVLGGRVGLLAVPAAGGAVHDLARRLAEIPAPTGVGGHLLAAAGTATGTHPGVDVITDSTGTLVGTYAGARDRLFLVRPDCYLAVRIELAAADALDDAVARALGVLAPAERARGRIVSVRMPPQVPMYGRPPSPGPGRSRCTWQPEPRSPASR